VACTATLPVDEDAATLRLLIGGMYDTNSQVSKSTVEPLLELARKYDVDDIRLNCDRYLTEQPLSTSTLPRHIRLACTSASTPLSSTAWTTLQPLTTTTGLHGEGTWPLHIVQCRGPTDLHMNLMQWAGRHNPDARCVALQCIATQDICCFARRQHGEDWCKDLPGEVIKAIMSRRMREQRQEREARYQQLLDYVCELHVDHHDNKFQKFRQKRDELGL
jgi:hypothetical protein